MSLNLQALSVDELVQLRLDVAEEQERRDRLAQAPDQVAEIAAAFREAGGDCADLTAAIEASSG